MQGTELLDVAKEAASMAADVIEASIKDRGSLEWKQKGESDFVTEVDTRAEAAIIETIHSHYRDAVIVGEELSPETMIGHEGITFVVDPLDGTTNFLHGYPEYSVSIAAVVDGELVAGVVRNLTRPETFSAVRGGGAFLNDERISVSKETEPYRSLIGTGFPFKRHDLLEKYARQFIKVSSHTAGVRRAGSAAIDLSHVACGRFDAFWELVLAPWDIAAGVLIVREAGGIVTDLAGNEKTLSHGPVVAGNPDIHPFLLQLVTKAIDNDIESIK
ncbi:MAG TPA: inositol monophosphatase family protein [Gemmatimonadaceae bacterium]|nr:inositol monophosphatase family protein [Gemmatimonadaceae bacterium]